MPSRTAETSLRQAIAVALSANATVGAVESLTKKNDRVAPSSARVARALPGAEDGALYVESLGGGAASDCAKALKETAVMAAKARMESFIVDFALAFSTPKAGRAFRTTGRFERP